VAKSERLFEMLQYIKEYPHLTARDLAHLCKVSERGIYRYMNTLSRAGISVRFQDGGYKLTEDGFKFLEIVDAGDLRALRALLFIGMQNCDDDELIINGRKFVDLIDEGLPKRAVLDEIEITPKGLKTPHYGGAVTIGHSSKPDIINPILTSETISVTLMNLIFSGLVTTDGTGRPVPDLARDWDVSKDGLVWTFSIRDDVKFHDGYPLTAHDVEFTYRSIMDPENASPRAERYKLIDGIRVEDDYTLSIMLKYPFAPFACWLGWPIAPKHLLKDTDIHNTLFNRQPVGSGPFKLVDWAEDDTIVLDANREYFHRGRPILDSLIFKAYPDRETALQSIAKGDMDVALNLASSDLLFVSRRGGFRIYSAPGASYYAIIFNLKEPVFKDIRVRMALDYTIDRESIVKNQLKGYSSICTGPFSVNSWAYNSDIQPTPHRMDWARELLAQAGWKDTDGDGVLDKDGMPFEFSLTVPNISDSLERIAVAIRAQLMKVGIRVKLIYIDDSKLYRTPFQTILAKIAASADPDYAYGFWHSEAGYTNISSYRNRFTDELLEQGRMTTDFEKRKAIYQKIHEIIHDDCPAIFLASGCEFIGSNYRFRDARFSSTLHFLMTTKDWQFVGKEKEDTLRKSERKANVMS